MAISVQFKSNKVKPPVINRNVAADVRRFIPDTAQTNPNSFPAYEFVEFPKMMLHADGPYVDEASGMPIVVEDEDEEAAFREQFPDARHITNNNTALNAAEREELEALRARRSKPVEDDIDGNSLDKAIGGKKTGDKALKGRDGRPLPKNLD